MLHEELIFTSPQDRFDSADTFLDAYWIHSTGRTGIHFVKEVYEDENGFVILRWLNEDGSSFMGAEYLELADGRIKEIIVVNNDPQFEKLVS